jgi:hypothetical protein
VSDLVFWAAVALAVLLFGRLVLAMVRRFLPLVLLALLLVFVLTQCEAEVRGLFDIV